MRKLWARWYIVVLTALLLVAECIYLAWKHQKSVNAASYVGIVTDTSGHPIDAAYIEAFGEAGLAWTETDSNGRYEFGPGWTKWRGKFLSITASHPAYTPLTINRVKPGETPNDFVLRGLSDISGRVIDSATGEAVETYMITFASGVILEWIKHPVNFNAESTEYHSYPGFKGPSIQNFIRQRFANADGRFHISNVESRVGTLCVSAQGYEPTVVLSPPILSGAHIDNIVISLDRTDVAERDEDLPKKTSLSDDLEALLDEFPFEYYGTRQEIPKLGNGTIVGVVDGIRITDDAWVDIVPGVWDIPGKFSKKLYESFEAVSSTGCEQVDETHMRFTETGLSNGDYTVIVWAVQLPATTVGDYYARTRRAYKHVRITNEATVTVELEMPAEEFGE